MLSHVRAASAAVVFSLILPLSALGQLAPPTQWIAGGHFGLNALAISPDGALLATGSEQDNTAKLYDAATGAFLRTCTAHNGSIEAVAFSPDGTLLATAAQYVFGSNDVQVKLWDVATATVIRTFDGATTQTGWSLAFSPNGAQLACGEGTQIKIYDVASGALLRTLSGHTWYVFGVAYSPDGTILASASGDKTVKLWRVSDGALRRTLTGHTGFVHGVAFSPDGTTVASASWDGTSRMWLIATGALLHTLTGHTDAVQGVAYAPDGVTLATCASDNAVRIWNAASGALVRTIAPGSNEYFNALQYGPAGATLYTAGFDGHPRAYDPSTGALVRTYGYHTAGVTCVGVSPDGSSVFSGSRDQTARRFSTAARPEEVFYYYGHKDVINALSVAPDGQRFATAAGSPPPDTRDSSIIVWNVADGTQALQLSGHVGGTFAVAYSPDGQYIGSGGNDGTSRFWRTSDGTLARVFSETPAVHAVAFSPDSTRFATGGDGGTVRVYRVGDGALLVSIAAGAQINALAFSPSSGEIAVALSLYGNNIAIYDAASGALVRALAGHANWTASVAFSPDGAQLLSGGAYDYEVTLWRVADGAVLATYGRETGWGILPCLPVAFSPDGQTFAYGRNDGPVVLARNAFLTATPPPAPRKWAELRVRRIGPGTIGLTLPGSTQAVHLDAFNIRGVRISRVWSGVAGASGREVSWSPDQPGGVYLVRLSTVSGSPIATARLVLLR